MPPIVSEPDASSIVVLAQQGSGNGIASRAFAYR
jgi:hypothetical protein